MFFVKQKTTGQNQFVLPNLIIIIHFFLISRTMFWRAVDKNCGRFLVFNKIIVCTVCAWAE